VNPLLLLLIGMAAGAIGSVPLAGPIAIWVLDRGLARREAEAVCTAVGGAAAETLYCAAAMGGMGTLWTSDAGLGIIGKTLSALVLAVVGVSLWRKSSRHGAPSVRAGPRDVTGRLRSLRAGFMVSALNPTLLVSWSTVAVLLRAQGVAPNSLWGIAAFACGVFSGIVLWFVVLARVACKMGAKLGDGIQRPAVRVAALLLIACGLVSLGTAAWDWTLRARRTTDDPPFKAQESASNPHAHASSADRRTPGFLFGRRAAAQQTR
jgi:threonine/homoserine/homoserine lactone efflux protein